MKEVPNRRLVGILIVVMFIAVAGTFFSIFKQSITGYATSGTVQLTIGALATVNVNSDVNFGQGGVATSLPYTQLSTEAVTQYGTFNNCSVIDGGVDDPTSDCTGIEIENQGNSNVNLTIIAVTNITDFYNSVTDEGANFTFAVLDGNRTKNETAIQIVGYGNDVIGENNASCHVNGNTNQSIEPKGSYLDGSWMNWTTINNVDESLICGNLSFVDGNDTITVEFNLTIPGDEPAGSLLNTFTFTATSI